MSEGSESDSVEKTEYIFVAEEYVSSEEPPMDEWSSLVISLPEENKKKILLEQGLYHPGSGEICGKNLLMSDSSIFRHLYYNYPAVQDPGIMKALFLPPPSVIYSDDGQELYLAVCKEMGLAPVRKFARGLLGETIDLSYYCVDPRGVRPMAMALSYNRIVKTLNLSGSFLSEDSCFHLGEMFLMNSKIQELNLSGCRIKSKGAQNLFHGLTLNRTLKTLNLNKNELGDDGVEHIAKSIFFGLDVPKLSLSYNNIGTRGAIAFAEIFYTHNKFVSLDLSWNSLIAPGPTYNLLLTLGESNVLQEIDLSWNSLAGPRVGLGIKLLMKAPNLRYLNLSNNRFAGEAILNIIENLGKAPNLETLDLSYNPMSPTDALNVLNKMKLAAVKVQRLLLDNVFVNDHFLVSLNQIKKKKYRQDFEISYGGVIPTFVAKGKDPRDLVLNRADYLSKRKRHPVDIALFVLQLVKKNVHMMPSKDFLETIQQFGAPLDEDLVGEICNIFEGPRRGKERRIDLFQLAEYMKRMWPDRKLPVTPPPEPEPEPVPEPVLPKGKDKKGKGKGKKN